MADIESKLRVFRRERGLPQRQRAPEEGAGTVKTLIEDVSRKAESGHIDEAIAALEQVVEMCRGAYLLAEARFLLATLRAKGAPSQARRRFRRRSRRAG